jgi:Zn finger protein HypA/HybF involved in hydrogenase expression
MVEEPAGTTQILESLVCLECQEMSSDTARGWRAYVFEHELLVYCPACTSREFEDDG